MQGGIPYSSLKAVGKLLGLVDPVKSATSAYISYHWNSERIRRAWTGLASCSFGTVLPAGMLPDSLRVTICAVSVLQSFMTIRPVFSESAPILLVRRYMIRIHLAVIIGFHVQGISETGW